jgi:hypothetical protein
MPPRSSRREVRSSALAQKQSVVPRDSHKSKLLPRINGPKIGPFKHPDFKTSSDFHFEELLNESARSSEGGEGYVFKARLNGRTYAMKVVSCIFTLTNQISQLNPAVQILGRRGWSLSLLEISKREDIRCRSGWKPRTLQRRMSCLWSN